MAKKPNPDQLGLELPGAKSQAPAPTPQPSTDVTHNGVQDEAPAPSWAKHAKAAFQAKKPAMGDTSWFSASTPKEKDPEAMPHPFRYGNIPPNLKEGAATDYLKDPPHVQAEAWRAYHHKAEVQAISAGLEGAAAKHKALVDFHDENWKHLKPAACEHCKSEDHTTEDHNDCSKCGVSDHETEDHPCDYCGSTSHDTDDHKCEQCGEEGHDSDSCETPHCDNCDEWGHDESDCSENSGTDEDDDSDEDERIGWNGGDGRERGNNLPVGPLGERVAKQLTSHGDSKEYGPEDVETSKYARLDRAVTRKISDRAVHTDDLYRAYKHTPHIGPALLLKYIVHRVNHLKDYDNKGKAERLDKDFMALHQFGGAAEKNGQLKIGHLHYMLENNPHLVDQLVGVRDAHQNAIRNGVGLNMRKINGQDYVALTRGLHSKVMNHEHALSSFADTPNVPFGSTKHHTWVPLKDIWYAYDLGSRYPKGNHGAENEFLVSHNAEQNGHRYKAAFEDVKGNSFKDDTKNGPLALFTKGGNNPASGGHHWKDLAPPKDSVDRVKFAPKLKDATDKELAAYIDQMGEGGPGQYAVQSRGANALEHKNAGPETFQAAMRHVFAHNEGNIHSNWLATRGVPADAALAQLARFGDAVRDEVVQNPNLTNEQVGHVLSTAKEPDDFTNMVRSVTNSRSQAETDGALPPSHEFVHGLLKRLDDHVQAHGMGEDSDAEHAGLYLTRHLAPEQKAAWLSDLAARPIHPRGPNSKLNSWNFRLARQLIEDLPPAEARKYIDERKKAMADNPDLTGEAALEWQKAQDLAPPTDKEVHDFAEHGNPQSEMVRSRFTGEQQTHIMEHGNEKAVDALLKHIETRQHYDDEPWHIFSEPAQKAWLNRVQFGLTAKAFAEQRGLTPETVKLGVERFGIFHSNIRRELVKAMAENRYLSEQTIKEALPPSAKEQLPFMYDKFFRTLSSGERKKVVQYKKDHPESKPVWDLLLTRTRTPSQPKDHIVKPLPIHELHRADRKLGKALPGFRFPKLGAGDDRRETPILTTHQQVSNKLRGMANSAARAYPEQAWAIRNSHDRDQNITNGVSSVISPTTQSYSKGNNLRKNPFGPKSDLATKLHEDLHNTFMRVQRRYGMEGRKNLAANLMTKLKVQDPEAHNALHTMFTAKYGLGAKVPFSHEEHLTSLLNYLNDPGERDAFHRFHFGSTNTAGNRDVLKFNQAMKRAYKHTLRNALQANNLDALAPGDRSNAEMDSIGRQLEAEKSHK